MTTPYTPRSGHIVEVVFLDHVQGGKRPMRCTVYGKLVHVSRQALVVDCWIPDGSQSVKDSNTERFTIVRSAVVAVTRLVRATRH